MNLELSGVCSKCANWQHNSSKASGCEPFHFLISSHETGGMAEEYQSHLAKQSDLRHRTLSTDVYALNILRLLSGAGCFIHNDVEDEWRSIHSGGLIIG